FDRFGEDVILPITVALSAIFGSMSFYAVHSFRHETAVARSPAKREDDGTAHFTTAQIVSFFAVVFLMWFSFAPYNAYFSVHLRQLGWSGSELAIAWLVGVLAETFVF